MTTAQCTVCQLYDNLVTGLCQICRSMTTTQRQRVKDAIQMAKRTAESDQST